MDKKYYAHSLEGKPPSEWQPLEEHLKKVAEMAADFARPFGGDKWAYLAGLWHDLGKYSDAFQAKLFAENGIEIGSVDLPRKVVHSEAGGHHASLKGWKGADRVLSWLIMCHHTGLTDFSPDKIGAKALEPKMRNPEQSKQIIENIPTQIANQTMPRQIIPVEADPAFFIRMLFSCLVDADFLDTEAFMDNKRAELRGRDHPSMESLLTDFDQYVDGICSSAKPTPINKIRAEVLNRCRIMAAKKPTIFSLTVPTGGGKTLSSLAFALRHAVTYQKRRIIYVIPYTSIIEQTAAVLRNIPGFKDAVLEHHCNVAEIDEEEVTKLQLASENWDMPIIVTTSVQFFESLYGCRSSRCRKLHNIVNSVVVFDEIQCLPPKYIRPIIFAIRELFRHYLVTPLLCTATQPVLTQTEQFDFTFREGFKSVTEIVENPKALAEQLKRVQIELFRNSMEETSLEDLAKAIIAEEKPVLCIVNRKEDARHLSNLLPEKRTMHLSTNMCAEHRSRVFSTIRKLLEEDQHTPFFVVSTSLVEAGVDIDFPVVYRALAGLDSIAQAAGRCNREGRLATGKTVIFVSQKQPGYVLQPASITKELLNRHDPSALLSPASYETYFRQRFWQLGEKALDSENILQFVSGRSMNYYFCSAAEKFRLIDDDWQKAVIAPYGKAMELIGQLSERPWNAHKILRKLQRYAVNISLRLLETLTYRGYVRELDGYPGLFLLDFSLYHDIFGFVPPEESLGADPEKFMA